MKRIFILLISLVAVFGIAYSQGRISRPGGGGGGGGKPPKTETISKPDGYVSGMGYVDLGLPSGLKWAYCNVGANEPQDYGKYYAWGEYKDKEVYNDKTYLFKPGYPDYDIAGDENFDIASMTYTRDWRMPTEMDFEELLRNCTWKWIKYKNVKGYKVTGKNGKSIFLPAAGYYEDDFFDPDYSVYWSSTPGGNDYEDQSWCMAGESNGVVSLIRLIKSDGLSVRPVLFKF